MQGRSAEQKPCGSRESGSASIVAPLLVALLMVFFSPLAMLIGIDAPMLFDVDDPPASLMPEAPRTQQRNGRQNEDDSSYAQQPT